MTLLALALPASAAHALTIERAETRYHEGRYELVLEAVVAAPIASVAHVLRDYDHYPELDSRVQKVRVLERRTGSLLLYTELEACVSFVCRSVERVEEVTEGERELLALAVPERSDVSYGRTHTLLAPTADGATRVLYQTSVEPRFWIPRLIGRRAMLSSLRDATTQLFVRVETIAQRDIRTETARE